MEWTYGKDRKTIVLDSPPKQRLRITGHRIAAILGLDKYKTPFQCWCEITKILKAPFEESKYTIAGKAIEPKLIEYIGKYFPNVQSIEDYYGNNFKDYQYNNFKDDSDIFGGVIDVVSTGNDGKTIFMICECKTTSKPQEWANNQIPVTYLLQGALYSYLKGLDTVLFACSFLQEEDYAHPEKFEVNDKNTKLIVKSLKDILIPIDGQLYNIQDIMKIGVDWWNEYIETGISPEFDEVKDKVYLDMIRRLQPGEDMLLEDMVTECEALQDEVDDLEKQYIKEKADRLKILKQAIRDTMIEQDLSGIGRMKLNRSVTTKLNEKLLKSKYEKIYDDCCETTITYKLTVGKKKEEK